MSQEHSPISHSLDHNSLEFPFLEVPLPSFLTDTLGITRFVLMEFVAAGLICAVFIPLARHVASNQVTRGRWFNMWESVLLFVRDDVVKQGLHGEHVKRFLPFFWTMFFFIAFNNLLGQIPGGATATGNINVTAVLALSVFGLVLYSGIKASGPVGFWINLVPTLDTPKLIKAPLWVLMFLVETLSLFIRHIVLAIRLFANMFAGHTVQAVVLGFIGAGSGALKYLVGGISIAGAMALTGLELFVALLQAYVFCLLSSLFVGSAVDPHH